MNGNEINNYILTYEERLTRLCLNLCRNYSDAEDLFQETWLRVMKNYDKYDSSKDFGKWLFTICINIYRNNYKNNLKQKIIQFSSSDEKEIFISSLPDKNSQCISEYTELLRIIKGLPEKYRTVLVLRYFNDYSEKDVAEILEIPIGTVKSRLNNAKKIIKRRFSL